MEYRKVNAIIRCDALEQVEERLQDIGGRGLIVSHVKGYGEYKNFFAHNWLVKHARIEIFAEKTKAKKIAQAIMEVAHTGGPGDGMIAVLPVEKVFRIRSKAEAQLDEI